MGMQPAFLKRVVLLYLAGRSEEVFLLFIKLCWSVFVFSCTALSSWISVGKRKCPTFPGEVGISSVTLSFRALSPWRNVVGNGVLNLWNPSAALWNQLLPCPRRPGAPPPPLGLAAMGWGKVAWERQAFALWLCYPSNGSCQTSIVGTSPSMHPPLWKECFCLSSSQGCR